MKNRNKDIYQTISEGCNREFQSYKKVAETPDKDTRGWSMVNTRGVTVTTSDRNLPGRVAVEPPESCGRRFSGWFVGTTRRWLRVGIRERCNIKSLLRSLCSESHSYEKMKAAEMPNTAIRAWNKTKTIPERSNRESQILFHSAFTLIELLVVVLIIGILVAIAVPQYEKTVWKTRYAPLKVWSKTIADAEELYYMANGTYTPSYKELDVQLPTTATETCISEECYLDLGKSYTCVLDVRKNNDRAEISCKIDKQGVQISHFIGFKNAGTFTNQKKCIAYGGTRLPTSSDISWKICKEETKDKNPAGWGAYSLYFRYP